MSQITLEVGPLLWQWATFDNWCDTAARMFRFHEVHGSDVVCVDSKGRVCAIGKHFMTARDEGAFPVSVYAVVPEMGE